MNHKLFCAIVIVFVELYAAAQLQAGCGHFFHKQAVVHHAAVVQPIVLYGVGSDLAIEAAVERAFQRRELKAPAQGTLQQTAPATSILTQKCARCHTGESAKGGIRLDGEIDDWTFRRSMEILAGTNVPEGMKGVVAGLQQSDFPAIMSEMLARKPQPAKEPEAPGVLR